MGHIEANVFQILNLETLKSQYRRYRIKGLTSDHGDFDRILRALTRDLSQRLKSPVSATEDDGQWYLIAPVDSGNPPSPFQVSNTTVYFEPTSDVTTLDYANPTAESEQICLRFLQSMINEYFYNDPPVLATLQRISSIREGASRYEGGDRCLPRLLSPRSL